MTHKKPHLPEKICAACGRPFSWRRKWRLVWDEVKYCSDRCRKHCGADAHDGIKPWRKHTPKSSIRGG